MKDTLLPVALGIWIITCTISSILVTYFLYKLVFEALYCV